MRDHDHHREGLALEVLPSATSSGGQRVGDSAGVGGQLLVCPGLPCCPGRVDGRGLLLLRDTRRSPNTEWSGSEGSSHQTSRLTG